MPCDEVRKVSVKLPNLNQALMDEALRELGYEKWFIYKEGELRAIGSSKLGEETKQKILKTYSKRAVKKVARKHGWEIQEKGDEIEIER